MCQASRFSRSCAQGRGAAATGRRVAWQVVENFQPRQLFHREHMPTGRHRARIQQGCCIQVYFLRYAFALICKGGATALAKAAPYPGRGAEITWGALGKGEDAPRHGNPRGQRRRRSAPAALAVAVQGPIRRAFISECDRTTQASALDGIQELRPPCCDGGCTLPLARILCQWLGPPRIRLAQLNGRPIVGGRDIWTQGRWWRQPVERCFWWWDQAVWARMPSFALRTGASYPMALSFRAAGSLRGMIGVR